MRDRDDFYQGRENFVQMREIVDVMKKKAKDSEENLESEAKIEREDKIEEEDSEHESESDNTENENVHEMKEVMCRLHDEKCCFLLC